MRRARTRIVTLFNRFKAAWYLARGWKHLYYHADYQRAVSLLEKAASIDPVESALTWLLLGHAYLGIKNVRDATVAYMHYYEIQKRTTPAHWSPWEESQFEEGVKKLADCLVWEGRIEELARIRAEIDAMRTGRASGPTSATTRRN